jgi:hypothetical protein
MSKKEQYKAKNDPANASDRMNRRYPNRKFAGTNHLINRLNRPFKVPV